MSREINEWFYSAIQNADLDRLRLFEKRRDDMTIPRLMDRKAFDILMGLPEQKQERLLAQYPEMEDRIPFETSLYYGNLRILEKNRERYFTDGWEKIFGRILLFHMEQDYIHEDKVTDDGGKLERLTETLRWIKVQFGSVPEMTGMSTFLSTLLSHWETSTGRKYKEMTLEIAELSGMLSEPWWIEELMRGISLEEDLQIKTCQVYERNQVQDKLMDYIGEDPGRVRLFGKIVDAYVREPVK